ncbi:hypothetical protein OAQ99_01615 [Candidatus Kapabacteria bacterium]|nr:hypothetical protein [Candidatus Kapabacteria bacterium]
MKRLILLLLIYGVNIMIAGPTCETPSSCWDTDVNDDPTGECAWKFELAIVPLPDYPECDMAVTYCKRTCPLKAPYFGTETQIYIYWTEPTSYAPSDCGENIMLVSDQKFWV